MKLICIAATALLCCSCHRAFISSGSQLPLATSPDNSKLLGIHSRQDLQQPPFNEWFTKNYNNYTIDSAAASQLQPLLQGKRFEIFMGTWCGDSKREVPRMLKILDYAGVPASQIKLVMVDDADSVYKQSPGHEETGKFIHRVPDLLVYSHEQEINRIVESPVVSLEKDLLAIAGNSSYQPNYKAAAYLMKQFTGTKVEDIIKDSTALAGQLQTMVKSSAELNALGYVWMATGELDKALFALELNAKLFPGVANVYDSLGEIYVKLNRKEKARACYAKVMALQPGNSNAVKKLAALQ